MFHFLNQTTFKKSRKAAKKRGAKLSKGIGAPQRVGNGEVKVSKLSFSQSRVVSRSVSLDVDLDHLTLFAETVFWDLPRS
jgi:hypothetical protein